MKTPPLAIVKAPDSELPSAFWNQTPSMRDRKMRIHQLIEKIQRNDGFKAAELKTALGSMAWQTFQQQAQSSRIPKEVAKLLRPYQEALQRADALNRRPARPLPSPKQRFKMGCRPNSAEMEYERASELLQILFDDDPAIGRWFDRPVRFGTPDEPTPDAEEMPRVRGSRSPYALPNLTRKELDSAALAALFAALETCKTVNPTPPLAWLLPLKAEVDGFDSVESVKSDADFACPVPKKLGWLL
jgi:hypothetical protein